MCVLFLAINSHPQYPLIVCANRDEFHQRPTQSAHLWQDASFNIPFVAGRDLQAGGTWLGVNHHQQFAALTNLRMPQRDDATSRGELVIQALQHALTPQWLAEQAANYNPFNLIFEYQGALHYFNSHSGKLRRLNTGVYAICNGDIDDIWPKMARGKKALEEYIIHSNELDVAKLQSLMTDAKQSADKHLPQTGVTLEWERRLSSIFITYPEYGTRCTSIIMRHLSGVTDFYEQSYDATGKVVEQQQFVIANQVITKQHKLINATPITD